jgi:hypothetical protein
MRGVLKAAYNTLGIAVAEFAVEALLVEAASGSLLFSVSEGRSAAAALVAVKARTQAIRSGAMNSFENR